MQQAKRAGVSLSLLKCFISVFGVKLIVLTLLVATFMSIHSFFVSSHLRECSANTNQLTLSLRNTSVLQLNFPYSTIF